MFPFVMVREVSFPQFKDSFPIMSLIFTAEGFGAT